MQATKKMYTFQAVKMYKFLGSETRCGIFATLTPCLLCISYVTSSIATVFYLKNGQKFLINFLSHLIMLNVQIKHRVSHINC